MRPLTSSLVFYQYTSICPPACPSLCFTGIYSECRSIWELIFRPMLDYFLKISLHISKEKAIKSKFVCFVVVFLIVCFTSYFVFSIAVLPHSPGVMYYHLLFRRETRIPGVAPFSFRIGIWDLFVHRGQKSYTPKTFGKLWTTPGVRCMEHASS